MKIAVDSRELKYNHITGTSRYLRLFLNNLNADEREKVCLLVDDKTDFSDYKDLFKIIVAQSPVTLWYDQVTIPAILRRNKIDVFFSPFFKIPFFAKSKRVITIHDLHFLKGILRTGISRFKPFICYLRQAIRSCDKIITVSEFSKQEIISMFKTREDKIKVVYNGIAKGFKAADRKQYEVLRSKYAINYEYILYVGNMKPHKNIEGLIKAYNLLGDKNNNKLIIMAKKDKNFRRLENLVKSLSLERKVVFLDFVSDEDLVLFYSFANAFVFPSFYEGFGLPPAEAMACGVPVVASDATSLKEILGEAALYFNPYNIGEMHKILSELISNDKLKSEYRNKGIIQAEKYSAKQFSENLFKELIDI